MTRSQQTKIRRAIAKEKSLYEKQEFLRGVRDLIEGMYIDADKAWVKERRKLYKQGLVPLEGYFVDVSERKIGQR